MTLFDKIIMQPFIPNWLFRVAIRYLVGKKLTTETYLHSIDNGRLTSMIKFLSHGPLATDTSTANDQHYCVPPAFFKLALGQRLKYSSGFFSDSAKTLNEAETDMLELTVSRARIEDGNSILELGCGWGSLTLFMAQKFPNSSIVAMSNSVEQKTYIDQYCLQHDINNVTVITANIQDFEPDKQFDRIISIEMFEHLSNYKLLFKKLNSWLEPTGHLFIHVFGHKQYTYRFTNTSTTDWMARHFFTGGIMPSEKLFSYFDNDFFIAKQWQVNGQHYNRTCNAWLANIMQQKDAVIKLFEKTYGTNLAPTKWVAWRIFFIACAELFGYKKGTEWMVFHYILKKKLPAKQAT